MIHHIETQVLIVLLVASLVGIGARRFRIPYTLALVVAGLLLGFVELSALADFRLSHDLLLLLFLPALLFEAAFHIQWHEFRREVVPIVTLATLGVVLAVLVTGGLTYVLLAKSGLVPELELSWAFVFASLIVATDPISVLALFRALGVAPRLYLLVEGESLLNDGVAVVIFFIVLAIFGISKGGVPAPELSGLSEIASYSLVKFVTMALGGALVGLVICGGVSALTKTLDDHLIEVTLTMLVAYGSFLIAENLGTNGVLSTVTAGLTIGSVGAEQGMSVQTKRAVEDYWEYMAFIANSFIFLLIGLELEPSKLISDGPAILIAFVVIQIARAVAVYGTVPIGNKLATTPVPRRFKPVMLWGGLRGSLSMVLVLSLPAEFAGRDFLINLVFGVVALSLFVQGLTVKPLLQKLELLSASRHADYDRARARVLAARRALHEATELHDEGILSDMPYNRLRSFYESMLADATADARRFGGSSQLDEQLIEGLRRLAEVERNTLRHSARAGLISDITAEELEGKLVSRLVELDHATNEGDERLTKLLTALVGAAGSGELHYPDPAADEQE